jgi:hypothetical protein
MKRSITFVLLLGLAAVPALADSAADRVAESRAAVKDFAGKLKGELVAAIKAGGPVKALSACNLRAPMVASAISEKKGWRVARTSLKVRNPGNQPDAWERMVLERFEARKGAGEDPKAMEFHEVVTEGGKKVFRYMKAIPTAAKPCLACHGTAIAPEVAAVLDDLYPDDRARGFKAGDIRGAFTIRQPMD